MHGEWHAFGKPLREKNLLDLKAFMMCLIIGQ
jgi:hypothetical protein